MNNKITTGYEATTTWLKDLCQSKHGKFGLATIAICILYYVDARKDVAEKALDRGYDVNLKTGSLLEAKKKHRGEQSSDDDDNESEEDEIIEEAETEE